MSIPNIIYKIKGKMGIDKLTIMYLFIIVGVGIGSFGLGRLSVGNEADFKNNEKVTNIESLSLIENVNLDNNITETQPKQSEKRYVASKNGKMYYSLGCSGAKRIKIENEVWFSTRMDAEKSGYTFSTSCK